MKLTLSIIIVNWNVADLLQQTIQSIFDNPPKGDFEIIVVDNASTDDSLTRLIVSFPMVKVIANQQNVGFARANNQGIEIAQGKYILLLNPDTIVLDDALNKLINVLEKNTGYGMVGPQLVSKTSLEPLQGSAKLSRTLASGVLLDIIYIQRIPFIGSRIVKWLRYPYDINQEGFVEVISGSAMLFRSEIVAKIGGLNERFFMDGEDVEFCDRFRKHGHLIFYYPDAKIVHLVQSCTPKNPVDIFVNRFMSVARYYELKYGRGTYRIFRIMSILVLIPKFILKSVYFSLIGESEKFHKNKMTMEKIVKWRFVGDAQYLN